MNIVSVVSSTKNIGEVVLNYLIYEFLVNDQPVFFKLLLRPKLTCVFQQANWLSHRKRKLLDALFNKKVHFERK